jgi:hypothetical protein
MSTAQKPRSWLRRRAGASAWVGLIASSLALASATAEGQPVGVTVQPASASLQPNDARQFHVTVTGTTDHRVVWLINGIRGGAPAIGIVSPSGLYTAPADVPTNLRVAVEAASIAAPLAYGQAAVTIAASSRSGPSFYVATTGSNNNPGSAMQPWRTIQYAVENAPAGASIYVHGGVYHELVTIKHSGSSTAGFISVMAFPNETPVVDGTGFGVPNGEAGLFTIGDVTGAVPRVDYIRLKGFEIRNYKSSSAAMVPVGIYVVGAGDHIELLNNHIHDIVTIVRTSAGDALGIAIYGTEAPAPLSVVTVAGNELDQLTLGFSESLAVSGNVENFQITNNLIRDNNNIGIDIAGFEGTAPAAAYDQARNGLVAGNTIYRISSKTNPAYSGQLGADGIYVDGGTAITIQQNRVYKADIGIEIASEHADRDCGRLDGGPCFASNVIARDNLVYFSNIIGISIGGYAARLGGTIDSTILNNTLLDNDTTRSGSGELLMQFHAQGNLYANNIVFANQQGLLVDWCPPNASGTACVKVANAPAALNYNLYFSTAGAGNNQWVWDTANYGSLKDFHANTGNDGQSGFADPQFLSLSPPDLQVRTTSPAIGAGTNLGLVATGLVDFAGHPRLRRNTIDIGAYEH